MCISRAVVLGRVGDMGRIPGTSRMWPLACRPPGGAGDVVGVWRARKLCNLRWLSWLWACILCINDC